MDRLGIEAVSVALDVARRHGLPVRPGRTVSEGSNLLVELLVLDGPPLLARIPRLTGLVRPRPQDALGRDVALAGWLHAHGARVVPPAVRLPPGPHVQAGHVVTFWPLLGDVATAGDAELTSRSLLDLHGVIAGYDGDLPGVGFHVEDALRGVALGRDAGLVEADGARALEAAGLRFLADPPTGTFPLHGDAHPGNLLLTPTGPVWTDLEDTWRGPREWDLACLHETQRLDGAAAVRGYRRLAGPEFAVDDEAFAACLRLRRWHRVCWSLIHASRDRAHLTWARDALREWQA